MAVNSTTLQRNAVFDVLMRDAVALIRKRAPGFMESTLESDLAGDRADVLQIAIDCADACVRAAPGTPAGGIDPRLTTTPKATP